MKSFHALFVGAALAVALFLNGHAAAQASCNPGLTMRGVPCICNTITFTLTNNAGCHDCLTVSFNHVPFPIGGGLTLPGSPPYFVLYSGLSNGTPVEYSLTIPCLPDLVGLPFAGVNASAETTRGIVISDPITFTVCGGEIGDTVFCDLNGDGVQDPNEPPLAGVTVNLECDHNILTSTTTDANGHYLFDRLPIGNCRVTVATTFQRKVVGRNCPVEVHVDLAQTPSYLDADFCYVDCNPCDGKVTDLRLRYLGSVVDAHITVKDRDNNLVFDGVVQPDGLFAFQGVRSDGTFSTEIKIRVNGGTEFKIHTSCSRPIGPGLVFGDYEVISGSSRYGGPLCEVSPCERGKPCKLVMTYTGTDCSGTSHSQDPSKVTCSGDPAFATPVRIRMSNKANPTDSSAKLWFDGMVDLNGTFEAAAANANQNRLENTTYMHVFDSANNLLQTVSFHTSCSQPLYVSDQYGAARLDAFFAEGECGSGGGGNPDLCNGRPVGVRLQYTGGDCSGTSHAQDPSKVSCSGDPGMAPLVTMRVSDKMNPTDPNAKVWFTGQVALNSAFDALGPNWPGSSTIGTNTYVHVFDTAGLLLQTVMFHTSCSQPLRADDQFGSVKLLGLIY